MKALQQPPQVRKRFMSDTGREVVKNTRGRIRRQTKLGGGSFAPSADGKNRKLLKKMGKGLRYYPTPNGVKVTWPNGHKAKIARGHHDGFTEQYTASRAAKEGKRRGEPDYDAPATTAQADALIEEGYRRYGGKYRSGKRKGAARTQRVSKKWIRENMTVGQAGRILRYMRDEEGLQAWLLKVPARPVLGMEQNKIDGLLDKLANETRERMKATR
jgi:hypothetical protein